MAYHEYITVLPDNKIKCTLCDDIIQDNLFDAHRQDRKHRKVFIKSLMTINNIIIGNSDLFCYICDCRISEPITHVQCPSHQSKFNSIKELAVLDGGFIILPDKKSTYSSAYCMICDGDIEFIYDSIKCHIASDKHKRARSLILQPLNGIFSVEGNDKYLWCRICQIFFDNYVELICQHVENSEHTKKIGKIRRLVQGENIDIDNYLQDHKQDKALCKRCGIEVPCNVDNLQSHINGKKHKSLATS